MDFQSSPPFERSTCFYVIVSGNIESFQYFKFETNFRENKNLFQKTGGTFFVEITKIGNASFPYKIAISKANVKTSRMVSTKIKRTEVCQ